MNADAKELLKAVKTARLAATNKSLPVGSCVRLGDGRVVGTDVHTSTIAAPCSGLDGEPCVVPWAPLEKALGKLSGQVTIAPDGTKTTFTAGSRSYTLEGYPATYFPRTVDLTAARDWRALDPDWFRRAVSRALVCAGGDDTLLKTHGLHLFFAEGITAMATDSYRLMAMEHEHGTGEKWACHLRYDSLKIIDKLLRKAHAVSIAHTELDDDGDATGYVLLSIDGVTISTPPLPIGLRNWRQFVPESETFAVVDRRALLDAIDAVSIMAQKNAPLRVTLNGEATLRVLAKDVGSAEEKVPCIWDEDEIEIGFDSRYLADGLKMIGGELVEIGIMSPLRPVVFGDDDVQYLIMPVRLSS